jgi:GNAT superfamily N-acetyltransferase
MLAANNEHPHRMDAELGFTPVMETLRDGTPALIRAMRLSDAPLLQAGFHYLSPLSVYFRFLTAHHELSEAEARQLATVDGRTRMALVAEWHRPTETGDETWIIGVARYGITDPANPTEAEAAVIVGDPFQGRGLGLRLLEHLREYAATHGVRAWVAEVNVSNNRMLRFIQRSQLPFTQHYANGVWRFRFEIVPPAI